MLWTIFAGIASFAVGFVLGTTYGGLSEAFKATMLLTSDDPRVAGLLAERWPAVMARKGAYVRLGTGQHQDSPNLSIALLSYSVTFLTEVKLLNRFRWLTWIFAAVLIGVGAGWNWWLAFAGAMGLLISFTAQRAKAAYFFVYAASDLVSAGLPLLTNHGENALRECPEGRPKNFLLTLRAVLKAQASVVSE